MIELSTAVRDARCAIGLSPATVAEAAGLDTRALLRFESGEHDMPGEVLWRLADVLGVPFQDLDSDDSLRQHVQAIAVRFKADHRDISERVRLAVARAGGAAREYVSLEEIAGLPSRYKRIVSDFPASLPLPAARIWKAGRDLAVSFRARIGVSDAIPSMLALVQDFGVLVLWQKLPKDVAGYAFCDDIHGAAVILNVIGRNVNDLVRRFTLAHEIGHVLYDRDNLQQMGAFDRYEDLYDYSESQRDPREVRANAFAIHLLAPESQLRASWDRRRDVRSLMTEFGVNFEAVRNHLHNYGLLYRDEKLAGVPTTATDEWKNAESTELWYPAFDVVPIERRHSVARLAFRLWSAEQITTNRLREALGVDLGPEELTELSALYEESSSEG